MMRRRAGEWAGRDAKWPPAQRLAARGQEHGNRARRPAGRAPGRVRAGGIGRRREARAPMPPGWRRA
ncbi:hypothetical protein, partial [Burkholderia gladioli]|uniref:hypothetical protein n=1 Tax=Burkholderia gladioli TaxID=28095 RepID=UPI001ABA1984